MDSITIISPPRPSVRKSVAKCEPSDVFLATSSRKRSIIEIFDENSPVAGSSKRVKNEPPVQSHSPVIDLYSSREATPVSSSESSGLEELTNTPTRIRISSPAARALAKRQLGYKF